MNQTSRPVVLILFSVLTLSGIAGINTSNAQEMQSDTAERWTHDGSIGLNFNQVALSNWAGGGENTFAVGGLLRLGNAYNHEKTHWENELQAGYGFTKIGSLSFRKSDDKLGLVSKFDHNATTHLFYSALLDFRSQFTRGFDYVNLDTLTGESRKISEFMAPGYLNLGIGGTWKPTAWFQFFLAPVSNRVIFVFDEDLSEAGAFGVDPGENIQSELGATSQITFQREIVENVSLGSKLNLFAPYDDVTSVILNWESLLNLKVNDYINASISLDVRYDEDVDITRDDGTVGAALQVKEALAIGFGVSI